MARTPFIAALKYLVLQEVATAIRRKPKKLPIVLYIFDFDKTVAIIKEKTFMEFGRVKGAKPNGEVFAVFKKSAISKPETTYILTARPRSAHDDIMQFLSDNEVPLSSENVACVFGRGASKSRWIKQKISDHKANEVVFWDDKMENIRAIDKLQADPDLKTVKITTKFVGAP